LSPPKDRACHRVWSWRGIVFHKKVDTCLAEPPRVKQVNSATPLATPLPLSDRACQTSSEPPPCPGHARGVRSWWQREVSAETRPAPRSLLRYEARAQPPKAIDDPASALRDVPFTAACVCRINYSGLDHPRGRAHPRRASSTEARLPRVSVSALGAKRTCRDNVNDSNALLYPARE